jgi:hypothetical protein
MKVDPLHAAINVLVTGFALLLVLVFAPSAKGQADRPHRLGDHPAVVVQRLNKAAEYDYAAKFYPHPAWLYLYSMQPHVVEAQR